VSQQLSSLPPRHDPCAHCSDIDRQKSLLRILAFFILVCTIVLAVLVQRLDRLINDAVSQSHSNHVVVCDIDRAVTSGAPVIECHDVPEKGTP
jgi:hypothetical protein